MCTGADAVGGGVCIRGVRVLVFEYDRDLRTASAQERTLRRIFDALGVCSSQELLGAALSPPHHSATQRRIVPPHAYAAEADEAETAMEPQTQSLLFSMRQLLAPSLGCD
jgi:hypothetical protein